MNACLIYVGLGCLFDGYLRFAQFTCLRTFHLSEAPEYVRLNLLVIARGVSML